MNSLLSLSLLSLSLLSLSLQSTADQFGVLVLLVLGLVLVLVFGTATRRDCRTTTVRGHNCGLSVV